MRCISAALQSRPWSVRHGGIRPSLHGVRAHEFVRQIAEYVQPFDPVASNSCSSSRCLKGKLAAMAADSTPSAPSQSPKWRIASQRHAANRSLACGAKLRMQVAFGDKRKSGDVGFDCSVKDRIL